MQERVKVYNEIESSQMDSYGYRRYSAQGLPVLTEVECEAISLINNTFFFSLNFECVMNRGRRSENSILITHYYVANLVSGQISLWKNELNQAQQDKLQKKLALQVNDNYKVSTSKLNKKELDVANEGTADEECVDVCAKIDFSEADIFWFAWGVVVNFQPFTHSSMVYGGDGFQIFVPVNEAKELLARNSKFSFLKSIEVPSTNIKSFHYQNKMMEFSEIRSIPKIVHVLQINPSSKKVKTLVITRKQLFRDGEANFQNKAYYDYNKSGQLLSIRSEDKAGNQLGSEFFTYDASGNCTEHLTRNKNNETVKTYLYDQNNNLISLSTIGDRGNSKTQYFYTADKVYSFDFSNFTSIDDFNLSSHFFNEKEFHFPNLKYLLNEQGKIKGLKATKHVYQQGQIARDDKGRMVESHFERDRYNYYWDYDELDRFALWQYFEYTKPSRTAEYFYDGNSLFPYRLLNTHSQYGNNTVLEEVYEWEFFE